VEGAREDVCVDEGGVVVVELLAYGVHCGDVDEIDGEELKEHGAWDAFESKVDWLGLPGGGGVRGDV
jgi:hypothetical protein